MQGRRDQSPRLTACPVLLTGPKIYGGRPRAGATLAYATLMESPCSWMLSVVVLVQGVQQVARGQARRKQQLLVYYSA